MNYRQQLDFLKENDISVWDVYIANAVDCLNDQDMDDEEFEKMCNYAKYLSLKDNNDFSPDCYVLMLKDLRQEKSWDEIYKMNKYDLLDKAATYAAD